MKPVSVLPASNLSVEAQVNPHVLHGRLGPKHVIEEEQPWHRAAAYLFAQGTSIKDVAAAVDKSPGTVSNLLRNRWFQERVSLLMAENGGRDIMDLLRAEAFDSLATLIQIRDDPKVSATTKLNAAKDLLDRALGKAKQHIEHSGAVSASDPVAEVERLERENSLLS